MAHLLIIELPGGNDFDIIEAAIARGDEFTFLTADLAYYQKQPAVKAALIMARQQIEVTTFAYNEVEALVLEVHAQHPIDAVLCLIDIRLIEAARLAQQLGVRYLNPTIAVLLRDKFSVRCKLAEHGLQQPDFELAQSNDELKRATERLGLPVLIKPADGYGSQNIVALRHAEDLDPLLTPLNDMLPCHADYGLGVKSNDRLVVERFMTGTVIGCDTFSVNGKHILFGINEKLFYELPSFAIRGGCFMPYQTAFTRIADYVFAVLDAVGFDWGAAHVELMITPDGPQLIEINPRLVGAKIPRLMGYALARSIHSDLIDVHLGVLPLDLPALDSEMVAVTRWIVAEQSGVLAEVVLPAWSDARIRCVELLKQSNDRVQAPLENSDRIGYVMVCGANRSEAEALAEQFIAQTIAILK